MVTTLLAVIMVLLAVQPAFGGKCDCVAPGDPGFDTGVIWQGDRSLNLTEIAYLLAPILWFSSDEPLLIEGKGPLPHPHPCDPDQSDPVVYYQVRSIRLSGNSRVELPEEEDVEFWGKVARLCIRYFFYYKEDRGFGAHNHDIETVELETSLEQTSNGCHRLRLIKAIGFAHGLDWYNNVLVIENDTRFPLTFLIEEGKHASCPDRNADGIYTPGYDVNRRINDAWGVRDIIGSGVLGSSSFEASMTKPREFPFRVIPPETPLSCFDIRNSSYARSAEFLCRYKLRAANKIPPCEDGGPEQKHLLHMMRMNKFGSNFKPNQRPNWDFRDLIEPLTYTKSWLPPICVRRDRSFGLGLTPFAFELGKFGYLATRINWIPESGDVSFEGMITPSASHFFSWYVTAGAGWEHDLVVIEDNTDKIKVFTDPEWRFVTEIGIKLRGRISGKWRILSLGYHFAGIRLGYRCSGLDDIDNSRFVLELGAGIF